jgi:hypothetical protein
MTAEYVSHMTVKCIDTVMEDLFQLNRNVGLTSAADTKEEFYGFRARDVACLHYSKVGWRRPGVWFRLHDGRVFDAAAIEQQGRDADPAWYDATTH